MEPIAPVEVGLPAARSALTVVRHWSEKKDSQKEQTHTRFFLTSLCDKDKSRAAQAARGHWAIENRNHYKRDASPWQEDRHRHRRPNAALNLALTRNALLAIIPFDSGQPLSHFFELYHRHPPQALTLILHARPLL